MINYKEIKGGVDASIARAINSTGKARQHIQHAAVSVLIHTAKHGDWRKAVTLVEGLGDGTVRALLKTAPAAHAAKASAELEDDKEKRSQILAQIDVTPDNIKALRKLIAA